MRDPVLIARGVGKSFGPVRALHGAELTLRAGEIHALMGENGAGKSTLIKVLTGVYERDEGSIELSGHPIRARSPHEAESLGIATVYQEVNLIPTLSIAENLLLGRQPRRCGFIRWKAVRERAELALAKVGLSLDVNRELGSCSLAVQQMVAIARALDVQAKVLILDEPTSSLDEGEVAKLFDVLRKLRAEGLAIVFVTHFLVEVYELTDAITVLRNGGYVGTWPTAELPRLELIGKMLGKEIEQVESLRASGTTASPEGAPLLSAQGLGRRGGVSGLDLEVRAGEVVGLAGLLGSGRTETARMLFGVDAADSGQLRIAGQMVALDAPRQAIAHGFAFCSEDRKGEGIFPNLSVRENLVLAMQASRGPLRLIPRAEQEQLARHYIATLNIKTPGPETPIRNLSGGNQQKVMLARWLAMQPKLIILDEPTRGIDVGAKVEIEKLIGRLRAEGMAVLFISSELEEIVRTCGRVAVLRDRRKVGELSGEEIEERRILHLIAQPHD